ncbi:hypothetical protein A9Q81_06795 [Gammaproteobacteria bacterium 42_54_T18]|nr:hypothetical protein A9Q81_06795 [Gammaproteobacteria bacterium 42_54_T18]
MSDEICTQQNDIQFDGSARARKKAIALLDQVLKEQGGLGVYGDLSDGVGVLIKDMNIRIVQEKDHYSIDIYPKSTSGGHDFSFTIDRKTRKMSGVVVGSVLPEPDIDS